MIICAGAESDGAAALCQRRSRKGIASFSKAVISLGNFPETLKNKIKKNKNEADARSVGQRSSVTSGLRSLTFSPHVPKTALSFPTPPLPPCPSPPLVPSHSFHSAAPWCNGNLTRRIQVRCKCASVCHKFTERELTFNYSGPCRVA